MKTNPSRRVTFEAWGVPAWTRVPAYAVRRGPDLGPETPVEAICRAIGDAGRGTPQRVLSCRLDYYESSSGVFTAEVYELTLGNRRGGINGRMWVRVPT